MCEYCESKYKIKYCQNNYETLYTKYNYNKNRFDKYSQLIKVDVPANFCSNCGRKLGE